VLARRGLERRAGETPAEFARRVAHRLPAEAAGPVERITDLYYRARYDAATREGDVGPLAATLLAELHAGLRRAGA
jgi:hypothetical protein